MISFKAVASGQKSQELMQELESRLKKQSFDGCTIEETIDVAITALSVVVSHDFKSEELEIGIVSKESPHFQTLSQERIDSILTVLADKDH